MVVPAVGVVELIMILWRMEGNRALGRAVGAGGIDRNIVGNGGESSPRASSWGVGIDRNIRVNRGYRVLLRKSLVVN